MGKVFDVVKDRSTDVPLDIQEYMVRHPASTFFMVMEGDGPEGSDIKSGDVVIIDRSVSPKKNDIAVVTEDGQLRVMFFSKNDASSGEVSLWGVVTGILRRFY